MIYHVHIGHHILTAPCFLLLYTFLSSTQATNKHNIYGSLMGGGGGVEMEICYQYC